MNNFSNLKPPSRTENNSSDEDSEIEVASSSSTRSKRLIKKPKILEDYHVSKNATPTGNNISTNVQTNKLIQVKGKWNLWLIG